MAQYVYIMASRPGGAIYVVIVVASVLAGPRLDQGNRKLAFPLHDGAARAVSEYGSEKHPKLTGTVILVALFFVSFVLYYFINWKYLSEIWLFQ